MRNPLWLLASAFLLTIGTVRAQDPLPEGAEIQARGPVHEAFAQPLDNARPEGNPVIEKQPPDPIEELPPEQKPEGDNVMWIPGYWQWDEDRSDFLWVSGVWRVVPPERRWMPGHWRRVDEGHQWVNGYWTSTDVTEQQYLPPPPEQVETAQAEPAPGDDYFYVPGCWVYRETRYVWRAPYWLRHRPGWVWQPACYSWSPAGYVYCDGYWDYPLERRGCLYAPVYFAQRDFRADWRWTPRYCVSPRFLTAALWVRPIGRHYYFGDYVGQRYARGGFTPWIDFRIGRSAYDPLFSYYRTDHRDRNWERDLRSMYVARREGRIDPPPRTLSQQERVLHNLNVRKNGDATILRNATALASLADVAKQSEVKLASVGREERDRHVKVATQSRSASRERIKVEQDLIQRKEAPLSPKAQPKTVKLPSLPSIAGQTRPDVKPPDRPEREPTRPSVVNPQDRPKPPPTDRPKPPEDRPKPPEDKPKPPPSDRPKPPEDKPKPPPQDRPKPPEDKPKPPPSDRPKPPEDKPKPPPQDRPKPPEDRPKPPPQERPKPPAQERPKPPDVKPKVPPPLPAKDPPREVPRERPRVDPPREKVQPPAPRLEVKPTPPREAPRVAPREVPREQPRVQPRERPAQPAPRLQAPVQAKPAPRVAPQPKAPQPKAQPSKPQSKPNRPRGR